MDYQVIPLIYAANENFKNTIRFAVELTEKVNRPSLEYAVRQVQIRYPYFSVKMRIENEEYVLSENDLPFVITDSPVCLNSEESNFHLLAFSVTDHTIFIDVSHFICDGNGIAPLVKTLLYYYIVQQYGAGGIDTDSIRLVSDEILEEEYIYPFPDAPLPAEEVLSAKTKKYDPFQFEDSFFDADGAYAYHLQIKQKELIHFAKANDGSPVSFISVMMFKALMKLFPNMQKDVIFQVPHEYRKALGNPLAHDCLARAFSVKLDGKHAERDVVFLNTAVRGQIILGSDMSKDIEAINGMVQLGAYMKTLSLDAKKQTMTGIISSSLDLHTFGVSYTGNIGWGGMEKYIRDVHPYAGEQSYFGRISAEIFTIGDNFSLCLMQPGRNPAFVESLRKVFQDYGVECVLTGEARYQMPDCKVW